jgi:hypothetical protein
VTTREVSLAVWAALALLLVVLCVFSALRPASLPTARVAIGAIESRWPGRVVLVLGWMWLGWHLFAR